MAKKTTKNVRRKKTKKKLEEKVDLADILFPSEEDDEHLDNVMSLPPEQRRLHTDTYDFAISSIKSHLESGHIFVPDFQREYVWDDYQASRLIESLIIQCPIPVLYLSQTPEEKLSVIDGNQRVNSVKRFLNNDFSLKGLTAYPELEGKFYRDLDPRFQRHILNRTLRCIVILKETHPQVKFDVFERLNTGSVKLSPQELRHGLYQCDLLDRVAKMAQNKQLKKLLPDRFSKRMRTEELILKYLAISNDMANYYQPVSGFLNDFLKDRKNLSAEQIDRLEDDFNETFKKVFHIFGEKSFKTLFVGDQYRNRFMVAVFDAEMLSIKKYKGDIYSLSAKERNHILQNVEKLFANDKFVKSITKATTNKNAIILRVKMISEALTN